MHAHVVISVLYFLYFRLLCMCIGLLLPNMKLVCRIYASVFIFRLVSVLSVADLFSVRVFILAFGGYKVFCVGPV